MIEQGSQAWLQMRLGKLTASRMADVLAAKTTAARRNYMAQLVAERLTGSIGESFTSGPMAWGTDHEPIARAEYEILTDSTVDQVAFVDHPVIAWCGASPDGVIGDDGLIEIKCPNTATHIDYLLGKKPPTKYLPQMALQLACTGRKWCDFVSYDPRMPERHRMFVVRYKPDAAYLAKIEEEAQLFLGEVSAMIEALSAETEKKAA